MSLQKLKKELRSLRNPKQAALLQRFFKTGKGQYGEGDVFLGLKVPETRGVIKNYFDISLGDVQELLNSEIHEFRLAGVLILVHKFQKVELEGKKEIFYFYLNNARKINNWDLVDLSAPNIVGSFIFHYDPKNQVLYKLAHSDNLWEKRISIISTMYFIRQEKFDDTLAISEMLLNDSHDLIHKAVGWMLREVGKKDLDILKKFLKENYNDLPRTTLRYAIEKFNIATRKKWLQGPIS